MGRGLCRGSYDLCILRSVGGGCAVLGWGQPNIFLEDFGKIVLVREAAALCDLADRKRGKTQIFTRMDDAQIVYVVVECDTHLFFEKLTQIRAVQMDVRGHLFQRDLLGIVVVNVSQSFRDCIRALLFDRGENVMALGNKGV